MVIQLLIVFVIEHCRYVGIGILPFQTRSALFSKRNAQCLYAAAVGIVFETDAILQIPNLVPGRGCLNPGQFCPAKGQIFCLRTTNVLPNISRLRCRKCDCRNEGTTPAGYTQQVIVQHNFLRLVVVIKHGRFPLRALVCEGTVSSRLTLAPPRMDKAGLAVCAGCHFKFLFRRIVRDGHKAAVVGRGIRKKWIQYWRARTFEHWAEISAPL